jgi:putative radical SAM-modified peptide
MEQENSALEVLDEGREDAEELNTCCAGNLARQ